MRTGASLPLVTLWAPEGPGGKQTVSPGSSTSSRSPAPAARRSAGRPSSTSSHSSEANSKWYGHTDSPGARTYTLPPIIAAPIMGPSFTPSAR